MTEKIALEVRPKKGKKIQKVRFLKSIFLPLGPLGVNVPQEQNNLFNQKNVILPRQMAEKLAVEVNVKHRKIAKLP